MKKPFRILESEKTKFVRGERLAKALTEATLSQLENGTKQMRQDAEQRADQARVLGMETHTFPPNGAIDFRGMVQGKSGKYQSIIFFKNVDYQKEDTPNNLTLTAVDGNDYHIAPINLQQNNCQVRCTCPDFRWTFSVQLQNNDSLYGEGPPLYQKKDPEHAPRNPQNIPGVCKHIMAFADELLKLGVLNATGNISTAPKQPERPEPEQPEVKDQNDQQSSEQQPQPERSQQQLEPDRQPTSIRPSAI